MSWRVQIRASIGALQLDVDLEGDKRPVALVGPNGSGKTSLLRLIAGAHRPETAEISVGERVFFSSSQGVDLAIEERRIGYVPQGYGLFPHLTVIENVAFGLSTSNHHKTPEHRRQIALDMLTELDCAALADRKPGRLSGGEQQRVALARALVIEPVLLLLDEPFAAMDATSRRQLRARLGEGLHANGRPSIVVTHDVRDVIALGASVCVLEAGRIVQRGSVEALRAAPCSDFVAEFFGVF